MKFRPIAAILINFNQPCCEIYGFKPELKQCLIAKLFRQRNRISVCLSVSSFCLSLQQFLNPKGGCSTGCETGCKPVLLKIGHFNSFYFISFYFLQLYVLLSRNKGILKQKDETQFQVVPDGQLVMSLVIGLVVICSFESCNVRTSSFQITMKSSSKDQLA